MSEMRRGEYWTTSTSYTTTAQGSSWGQAYHLIGFDEIKDNILRDLVVARICEPASKRSTLEYLKDYFDEDYTLNKVCYYLDKLGSKQKNTVRRISVEHTRKILGGKIGLMFYDCTYSE